MTWVGRIIMNSILVSDRRAVVLCIDWLRTGYNQTKSKALKYALGRFTGNMFETDEEWIEWYDKTGIYQFPKPDFNQWMAELKRK